MHKEWSELNKTIQQQLKKEITFKEGIETLLSLRQILFQEICILKTELDRDDFNAMPFRNANGYHNKTIAYSLWHIFRIEDIVAHTLIAHDEQIFMKDHYQQRIHSSIITTGNELQKQKIVDFSTTLNIDELYQYITAVMKSSNDILKNQTFIDLKYKITQEDKQLLQSLHVVSEDEHAKWLIDYWCDKDIKGLIQMPLSRHWIMHVEACIRIKEKIK